MTFQSGSPTTSPSCPRTSEAPATATSRRPTRTPPRCASTGVATTGVVEAARRCGLRSGSSRSCPRRMAGEVLAPGRPTAPRGPSLPAGPFLLAARQARGHRFGLR